MAADDFYDEGSRAAVAAPPVSPIAAKAGDLEAFRKSVEDSAGVSGGLWLSYLFVLFYLGIAAGAVTHADLLLQSPVKLPFLNIELPLLAFFVLAPVLFVVTHAYTLVNLALLADRVRQFHKELGDQLAAESTLQPRASEIRAVLTRQLPSNIFVQFLGGPDEIRKRALGEALAVILWLTLVVAPIALLLLLQIQFLPYHNQWVTWINRAAIIVDLGLIWWLWGNILRRSADHSKAHSWGSWAKTSIAVLLSLCTILFACAIATIPAEWQEDRLPYRAARSLREWIFFGTVDNTTRRRASLFSNTLVLPGLNIYEALKIDDPKKVEWKPYLIDLRGRHLESAVLDGAVLPRADLSSAQLQGSSLAFAQLRGASLTFAQLQDASLESAELRGASLGGAQLKGSMLERAQLQGASLIGAQLQGASLDEAHLQGASLDVAQLQGASLNTAQLQGASLEGAQLQGASLGDAQLQGASLERAQLQGAWLANAELQGASLERAELQGAGIDEAHLQGANLTDALLWRAQLKNSVLENIFAEGGRINWSPIEPGDPPRLWTDATYADLRQSIDREVPVGRFGWPYPHISLRGLALERVAILDCGRRDDDTLASCDPSDAPPDAVKQWKKMIVAASIDRTPYTKALAAILGDLVCSDDDDSLYVLRGLLHSHHLLSTGPEKLALVKRITSAECPLSTALTDADKRAIAAASHGRGIRSD
jgi:uncharacterized protein YjbI with pentapeptide repeats